MKALAVHYGFAGSYLCPLCESPWITYTYMTKDHRRIPTLQSTCPPNCANATKVLHEVPVVELKEFKK